MILPIVAILFLVIFPNIVLVCEFGNYLFLLSSVLIIGSVIALLLSYRIRLIRLIYTLVLFFEVPKFNLAVAVLVGGQIERFLPGAYNILVILAIIADICFILIVFYGFFFGWKHLVLRPYSFTFKDLPQGFDGFRIIQISDLHLGSFMTRTEFIEKLVDKINKIGGDLIVFTGDIINLSPYELPPFKDILSKIKGSKGLPVYAVLGNHDYCIYGRFSEEDRLKAVEQVCENIKDLGWKLLMNESEIVKNNDDSIAIVGVENDSPHYDCSHGDLQKAQQGLPEGIFKVLLSHDPTFWRKEVLPHSDIQLTLSGHTHAMQLKIGSFTPSKWRYPEWGGSFTAKGRKLLVSLGIGGSVAFRFGAWPEIDILTLKRG